MKFTVKNSKSMPGRDGLVWSADIYIDGKKAISAFDGGYGGPVNIEWFCDNATRDAVNEHVKTLPPYESDYQGGVSIPRDLESLIGELVDNHESMKKVKRMCVKKTLIRLNTDEKGSYTTFNLLYSPQVKAALIKKFGDKIIEFTNEVVANS